MTTKVAPVGKQARKRKEKNRKKRMHFRGFATEKLFYSTANTFAHKQFHIDKQVERSLKRILDRLLAAAWFVS
jgi:hypothetical protein